MLSGRGVWAGMITRPEESYRLWCLNMIMKPRMMRRPWSSRAVASWKNKFSLWLYCWRCRIVTHSHHLVVVITLP